MSSLPLEQKDSSPIRPMRPNRLITALLSASGVVMAVNGGQCQPTAGPDDTTLGIPSTTNIQWQTDSAGTDSWSGWEAWGG